MQKQFLIAATLLIALCSCDQGKINQNQVSESNDSAIVGHGVGYDSGTGERPAANAEYPNRRKHTFLHPSIPSIGANIDAVRFFEGPYYPPAKEQRQYRISFDARRSRYINWELNLTHKAPGQIVTFQIDSEWYRGGKLFYRYSSRHSIESNWEYSYMSHSYTMGQWTQGIYRVDLWIGKQKIASEYFDIYNADCSGDLSFKDAGMVDDLRRQSDSMRLAMALHNRGGQCLLNGHLDAALQDFSEAIQTHSDFSMAYYHRGLVLMELKRPKEALADLEVAIRDVKSEDYYAARARVQFQLENDPEALSDFNRAIELDPKRAEFYHDRGIVLYYLGEDENSLRDLKQAASMYQSTNEPTKSTKVNTDIDILEGRTAGNLNLYDRGRLFTLAEINE